MIRQVLNQWGIDPKIYSYGREILETLKEDNKYDIILMDLQVPKMDGIITTKIIRNGLTKFKDIPIIALTADAFIETKTKVIINGFNDFLTKPFKADILTRKLRENLPPFLSRK